MSETLLPEGTCQCVICMEVDECCLFPCTGCTAEYCLQCIVILSKGDDHRCSCCRRELVVRHGQRTVEISRVKPEHHSYQIETPFFADAITVESMSTRSSESIGSGSRLNLCELHPVNELLGDSHRVLSELESYVPLDYINGILMDWASKHHNRVSYTVGIHIPVSFSIDYLGSTHIDYKASAHCSATLSTTGRVITGFRLNTSPEISFADIAMRLTHSGPGPIRDIATGVSSPFLKAVHRSLRRRFQAHFHWDLMQSSLFRSFVLPNLAVVKTYSSRHMESKEKSSSVIDENITLLELEQTKAE